MVVSLFHFVKLVSSHALMTQKHTGNAQRLLANCEIKKDRILSNQENFIKRMKNFPRHLKNDFFLRNFNLCCETLLVNLVVQTRLSQHFC